MNLFNYSDIYYINILSHSENYNIQMSLLIWSWFFKIISDIQFFLSFQKWYIGYSLKLSCFNFDNLAKCISAACCCSKSKYAPIKQSSHVLLFSIILYNFSISFGLKFLVLLIIWSSFNIFTWSSISSFGASKIHSQKFLHVFKIFSFLSPYFLLEILSI